MTTIGKLILKFIYIFMKLFPTSDKIVMISSFSNQKSLDFKLLEDELKDKYKTICLCNLYDINHEYSLVYKIKYFFYSFIQMYHFATSKVCILDSYCPTVSLLNHKKSLTIIYMGSFSGILKKNGYSITNKKEGITNTKAKKLKMHHNYDIVVSSSKYSDESLMKDLNVTVDKIRHRTLPRFDLLKDSNYEKDIKRKIYDKYPQLETKQNIIYAPTYKIDKVKFLKHLNELIEEIDFEKYNLVVKLHPLMKLDIENDNIIIDYEFSTFDMLFVADKLISDYSSIIYEAGLRNIPLYFFAYNLGYYKYTRGLWIDYSILPGYTEGSAEELIKDLDKDYNMDYLKEFIDKYINDTDNCTKKMVSLISEYMNKK